MRNLFPAYTQKSDDEINTIWHECSFVFDANVLLHAYCYSEEHAFLSILGKVSDRLWLPHQAALEFYRNRTKVIKSDTTELTEIPSQIKALINELRLLLKRHQTLDRTLVEETLQAAEELMISGLKSQIDAAKGIYKSRGTNDEIEKQINALFTGKVGPNYTANQLEDIYRQGAIRYPLQIPPGFRDMGKGGSAQFGDLLIWFQIIDQAKESQRSVIFVTDDHKTDWWSSPGVPRPELLQEIFEKTGVAFLMYTEEAFIRCAERILNLGYDDKVIEDSVREINEVGQAEEGDDQLVRQQQLSNLQSVIRFSDLYGDSLNSPPDALGAIAGMNNSALERFAAGVDTSALGRAIAGMSNLSESVYKVYSIPVPELYVGILRPRFSYRKPHSQTTKGTEPTDQSPDTTEDP
jgi:PIN like domain